MGYGVLDKSALHLISLVLGVIVKRMCCVKDA